VIEVDITHLGHGRFDVQRVGAGEIQFNHHVFRRQHAQAEELCAIQEELEGDYGSFTDRVRKAFEMLGVPAPDISADQLEPYPTSDSPRSRWVNRPILFRSERSVYTHHLRRELKALREYPRLSNALGGTAAGMLAGISPPTSAKATREADSLPALLQVLPLNRGQEEAARAGLRHTLTVVTGPPGTGKSQVVVDLLASCALAGRPVLFASKNNKAVDVVRDRLREILGEERDWTLRLGSRNAMGESRQEMVARLNALRPDAVPTAPAPKLLHDLDEEVATARQRIENLERTLVVYAGLERDRRVAEGLVVPGWVDLFSGSRNPFADPSRVERLSRLTNSLAGKGPAGFWLKLGRALFPGFLLRKLRAELASLTVQLPVKVRKDLLAVSDRPSDEAFSSLAEACGRAARLLHWLTTKSRCAKALARLAAGEPSDVLAKHLAELQRRRAELACDQFRAEWTARLARRPASVRHALDQYFDLSTRVRQPLGSAFFPVLQQFKGVVRSLGGDLPVWVVTNLSVRNALPLEPDLFDLVIVDEASQCDIPSALPLLFRAKRAVIIGDPQQLRHISTLSPSEEGSLAVQNGVAHLLATWSYNQRSLYALAEGSLIERGGQPIFLAEHYRSHPEIIEFSNRRFYQGRLILRTPLDKLGDKLRGERLGVFWHDVPSVMASSARSAVNEDELRAVVDLLDEWARTGFLLRDGLVFGIVTPFRLQMERLEEAIRERPWWDRVKGRLTVGTAHRFQGDERDVMIFSPVVADGMPPRLSRWVANTDQLLNVAITRSRGALHVVGDRRACKVVGGFLGEFAASVGVGVSSSRDAPAFESPAEARMAELLTDAGLWYAPQYKIDRYRLDFLVVGPCGGRYNVEVDGRQHLTDDGIRSDEIRDNSVAKAGIHVLRVSARQVFTQEESVRVMLRRLV
jgi:very-short-patch-repair endonuclease